MGDSHENHSGRLGLCRFTSRNARDKQSLCAPKLPGSCNVGAFYGFRFCSTSVTHCQLDEVPRVVRHCRAVLIFDHMSGISPYELKWLLRHSPSKNSLLCNTPAQLLAMLWSCKSPSRSLRTAILQEHVGQSERCCTCSESLYNLRHHIAI